MASMENNNTYSCFCETKSSEETKQLAATLAPCLRVGDVIVLTGDLGAGKTQFVQGVAATLGIADAVTSPTFNILLAYTDGLLPLYHFDLYRLDSNDELEDIGFYETVDADGVSFIEWGEKFPDALPYDYLELCVQVCVDGGRLVTACAHGSRAAELIDAWIQSSKSRLVKSER